MAQVAYDLDYFAPAREPRPRVRVAKQVKREPSPRASQLWKTARLLLVVLLFVFLVCAVLYTQVSVTEVTTQIATQKKILKDEEAFNTYLSFELENKSSLKSIEEAAGGMGLSKVDSGQISYFRVEAGDGIAVKQGLLASMLQNAQKGLTDFRDYFAE